MFLLKIDNIEFDRPARIASGEDEGWYIKLVNNGPGDLYLLKSQTSLFDSDPVFDTWYETVEDLVSAVNYYEWLLEWI